MQRQRPTVSGGLTKAAFLFPFLSILFGVIGIMVLLMAGQATLALVDVKQVIDMTPTDDDARRGDRQSLPPDRRPDDPIDREHGGHEPVYIECTREGLVLHPERTAIAMPQQGLTQRVLLNQQTDLSVRPKRALGISDIIELKNDDSVASKQTIERYHDELLTELRQVDPGHHDWLRVLRLLLDERDRRYPVLLVRPDGIQTFYLAQALLDDSALDYGYDPVYGTGEIEIRYPLSQNARINTDDDRLLITTSFVSLQSQVLFFLGMHRLTAPIEHG